MASEMTPLRQKVIEGLRIRNYSHHTITRYIDALRKLAEHYNRPPDQLTPEEVREYLVHLVTEGKSVSLLKQVVCSVRFLFRETLGRDFPTHLIPFPREEQKLPDILSVAEVCSLIQAAANLKHQTLLATIYGTGIRLAELIHLKVTDIDSSRMLVCIRNGKGKKDRLVPLPPRLLELLRTYWRRYHPEDWLFFGYQKGQPLNRCTVQDACAKALKRAGLTKRITPHGLRHAFATHLLEAHVHIRVVQELLGHKRLRTTARYTHVTTEAIASARDALNGLPAFANLQLTSAHELPPLLI